MPRADLGTCALMQASNPMPILDTNGRAVYPCIVLSRLRRGRLASPRENGTLRCISDMHVLLTGIDGPVKGRVWTLSSGRTTVGRDRSNTVFVPDTQISRQHCELVVEEGAFRLRDLGSHNGTLVNDVQILDTAVEPGDEIAVGGCRFIITVDAERPAREGVLEIEEVDAVETASLRMRAERAGALPAGEAATTWQTKDLAVIQQLAEALGRDEPLDETLRVCLDVLLNELSADIAAVVLRTEQETDDLRVVVSVESPCLEGEKPKINRNILDEVLISGEPLFVGETASGTRADDKESAPTPSCEALICVPLKPADVIRGFLYLDSRSAPMTVGNREQELVLTSAQLMANALSAVDRSASVRQENIRLRAATELEHNIVGKSPQIRRVFAQLSRIAAAESPVLICGESGTGKELIARAIHKNSDRTGGPFVAINCASIPEGLAESELFGHEKGAFTGAHIQKPGPFEQASEGVLFLDEIGDLPRGLQAKLLRVLEEKCVRRLGASKDQAVDTRVIAATNADLAARVKEGTFREDLYYRLAVVTIEVPPLRERAEDIPLLASYFLHQSSRQAPRKVTGFDDRAMTLMARYPWPGNVRELRNCVERAVIMGSGEQIGQDDLPIELLMGPADQSEGGSELSLEFLEKRQIRRVLARTAGNKVQAAKLLGIGRTTLYEKLKQYGIEG